MCVTVTNACRNQFENRFSVKLQTNRDDTEIVNVVFVQPEATRVAVKEQLMLLNDWELSALDKVRDLPHTCVWVDCVFNSSVCACVHS